MIQIDYDAIDKARDACIEHRLSDGPVADAAFKRGFQRGWIAALKDLEQTSMSSQPAPAALKFNREVWINALASSIHWGGNAGMRYDTPCAECERVAALALDRMAALFVVWLRENVGDSVAEGEDAAKQFAGDIEYVP